jgi:hypothetical protein
VHINAEFGDQASDHDPQIVRLLPGCDGPNPPGRCEVPLRYEVK